MEFHTLIEYGVLDACNYAEVVQIILLRKKDNVCWNYFTHVIFSPSFSEQKERVFLTDSPISEYFASGALPIRFLAPPVRVAAPLDL